MTLTSWRSRRVFAIAIATAIFGLAPISLRGEASAAGTAQISRAAAVDIDHFAFTPSTLTVAKGAKVAFSNSSQVSHTATGASFDTKRIKPGASATVRFAQKGTFAYHCEIHPLMHGKIIVK